jgi:hypothetical protein
MKSAFFAIAFVAAAFASTTFAQAPAADAAKKAEIKKMVEAMTPPDLVKSIIDPTLETMKQAMPPGQEEFYKSFSAEYVKNFDADKFKTLVFEASYPIYDKNLSMDDIKELTKFYQSPLGRKMVGLTPELQKAAMLAGMKFGNDVAQKSIAEVQRKMTAAKNAAKTAEPAKN